MNGVSAPYFLATSAISLESVDTITLSILLIERACLIDHAIKGRSPRSRVFLLGNPFEPPRAKIKATAVISYPTLNYQNQCKSTCFPLNEECRAASIISNTLIPSFPEIGGSLLSLMHEIKLLHSAK